MAAATLPTATVSGADAASGRAGGRTSGPIVTGGVTASAVGDIACHPGVRHLPTTCQDASVARLVGRVKTSKLLMLGNAQYRDGSIGEYLNAYNRNWGRFFTRTLPVAGNIDYHIPRARGWRRYFGRFTARAVNVGSWRVYLLDSNCGAINCRAENRWFNADLTAAPHKCTLVVLNQPRYSSGVKGGSIVVNHLWRTAYAHGVDVVLSSHDRDYERFAPMDPSGRRSAHGITSFVVGTGGRGLTPRARHRAPASVYFQSQKFGVLNLRLGRGAWAWAFVTVGNAVLDRGSRSCV